MITSHTSHIQNYRREFVPRPFVRKGSVNYYALNNMIMVHGSFDDAEQHENLLNIVRNHVDGEEDLIIDFNYRSFAPVNLRFIFKVVKLLNKSSANGNYNSIIWQCSNNEKMDQIGLDLVPFCDFSFFISY